MIKSCRILRKKPMDYTTLAKSLVLEAGSELLDAFYHAKITSTKKPDSSLASQWDEKIEDMFTKKIRQHFPDHSVQGEERGISKVSEEFVWYIDPLDGTTNFINGIPIFCSMLSLYVRGTPQVAAVYVPAVDKLYWSEAGKGTYINAKRVEPLHEVRLRDVTLQIELARTVEARNRGLQFLNQNINAFRSFRRFGTYAGFLLGLGNSIPTIAIHFQQDQNYEVATGAMLFKEAGYAVVDSDGNPWHIQSPKDFICVPPTLKNELMSLIRAS
jgi:myo-inositol-1(or 4)-monophosphatase